MIRRVAVAALATALGTGILPSTAAAGAPAETFGDQPLDDVIGWATSEVAARAGAGDDCGLTPNMLTAIVLAPTYPETGAPLGVAPSPMTLSRWDTQPGLYSFGDPGSLTKAFWHPGIGPWQFDSAGGWGLDAAGRINTYVASAQAVSTMAARWCTNDTLSYVWAPWFGCSRATCQAIYDALYDDGTDALLGPARDAGVTSLGGMQPRTCQLAGSASTFVCHYVDPALAQGHDAFALPGFGPAPITAPFYVYSADGMEYRHWLDDDTGYASGIWASRPLGANARTSLTWNLGEPLCDVTLQRGGCCPGLPIDAICSVVNVGGVYEPIVGDFNGDLRSDILWYGPGAAFDYLWYGTAGGFWGVNVTIAEDATPVVGDFNGDARTDILFYRPGPDDDPIWYGVATQVFEVVRINVAGTYTPVVGDFNGNSRDDIFWYGAGAAGDYLWYGRDNMTGSFTGAAVSVSGVYEPFSGDFDGDGFDDVFWYGPGSAYDYRWYGTTKSAGSFVGAQINVKGTYAPVVLDADGDLVDDVFWYGSGYGADYLWSGTPARAFVGQAITVNGVFVPIVGDFDATGRDDVFWYGPGAASDALTNA